jgi:hypothetical protein
MFILKKNVSGPLMAVAWKLLQPVRIRMVSYQIAF